MGVPAADWLRAFGTLHARARRGELHGPELDTYREGRDSLARMLLAAQQIALPPGRPARRSLRVARALQVDVEAAGRSERGPTLDVSAGGLAAWLAQPLKVGDEVDLALSLPPGAEVRTRARVAGVQRHEGTARSSVGFQFMGLKDVDSERLEMFVFDAILEHLRVMA